MIFENTGLKLSDYDYNLPEEKIAKHPPNKREEAKLLVYKRGEIQHHTFKDIIQFVPKNATLVFNDTKVIPARLYFQKHTGALIEIFLLNPVDPVPVQYTMQEKKSCTWSCMVGNLKKWKENEILQSETKIKGHNILLKAHLLDRSNGTINFSWEGPEISFAEVLENTGEVPLPPYLKRKPTNEDKPRYQTVYSKNEGAVAAPTAGLHFTADVLKGLKLNGYKTEYLTLHVSAGTFQPIKDENVVEHPMHSEMIIIKKETLENLLNNSEKIIPVGTTSMRSLESIYWFGTKLLLGEATIFKINKLDPYQYTQENLPTRKEALIAILDFMSTNNLKELYGATEIFIFPGYKFKICDGLITNFHQPKSTLILLIAALISEDWKKVYGEALNLDYKFLSYGDSSLLLPILK
ncbi:MAG: S-adenosylmethionine:tRNA ribosyltransferase-isomerase [Bacteroidota bacterium]|nr:S-adenosylmethionine:tRNA ribosyltransferase-isomerase [Bacteroidota bacterium]